jgi:hypothetical protein
MSPRLERTRAIAYWTFTLIVALELVAGSLWNLLQIEWVRVVLTDLGYPLYLLYILGVWKLAGAVVLLVPRFQRLKEWAYAGAVFDFSGAAASHWLAGDRPGKWALPLSFTAAVLASWVLRPPDRRLEPTAAQAPVRPVGWLIPFVIVGAFVVLALLTLPKGPPP